LRGKYFSCRTWLSLGSKESGRPSRPGVSGLSSIKVDHAKSKFTNSSTKMGESANQNNRRDIVRLDQVRRSLGWRVPDKEKVCVLLVREKCIVAWKTFSRSTEPRI